MFISVPWGERERERGKGVGGGGGGGGGGGVDGVRSKGHSCTFS